MLHDSIRRSCRVSMIVETNDGRHCRVLAPYAVYSRFSGAVVLAS